MASSSKPTNTVTVEDATPSPEPAHLPSTTKRKDSDDTHDDHSALAGEPEGAEPTAAAGDEEEEWDPAAETDIKATRAAVVEKAALPAASGGSGDWQAIWAPANNAYYFWNSKTGATTWENPLVPPPSTSSQPPLPPTAPPTSSWGDAYGAPSSSSSGFSGGFQPPLPTEAVPATFTAPLPPIDPALSHLMPRGSQPGSEYQTAQFNARTGRFTPQNYAYTPDHLAEANRARRQEGVFFDVAEWERQREQEHLARVEKDKVDKKRKADDEAEGVAPKKLTKADMERFKQKKLEKKARNNAWLKN